VDHYDNPRNVGSFDKNDPTVGTGLVGAPACGDVMKLQIKVDETSGQIVDACFKTFGCGSAIASSSVGTFLKIWGPCCCITSQDVIIMSCCVHGNVIV
jgi:NifU-like protein involved in Fe-S cluster formation